MDGRSETEKKNDLDKKRVNAKVPGISMVGFNGKGEATTSLVQGIDHKLKTDITQDSVFRVASLSKPVFAYLVLKLIRDKKLGENFTLDTPLHKIFPDILKKFTLDDQTQAWAKELTVHNILTHQTGLPGHMKEDTLFKIYFQPGSQFGYSNQGISILQDFVEQVTKKKS